MLPSGLLKWQGRCRDNIFVERLWRSVKYGEVYLKAYQTAAEARAGIDAYPEFYNPQRPRLALGYRAPADVYQQAPISQCYRQSLLAPGGCS